MPTMRAAQFRRYGTPEVLEIATVPIPVPKAGEVLIRVGAASVNGGELAFRAGRLRALSGSRFPKGIGIDFAGEVAALGDGVIGLAVGERVWGIIDSRRMVWSQASVGAVADYVATEASRVGPIPIGLNDAEAASLLAGGTTALVALRDHAHLAAGERILIRGATGGVGSAAVQLARAFGAHVTALVGPSNREFVRDLGADEALDYTVTTPPQLGRYDVILDTVGSDLAAYRRHLTPHGRMVAIALEPPLSALGTILASTIFGSRRIRFFSGNPRRDLLAEVARYIESGALRAVVDSVYPLDAIVAAHHSAETRGGRGKRVIALQ